MFKIAHLFSFLAQKALYINKEAYYLRGFGYLPLQTAW